MKKNEKPEKRITNKEIMEILKQHASQLDDLRIGQISHWESLKAHSDTLMKLKESKVWEKIEKERYNPEFDWLAFFLSLGIGLIIAYVFITILLLW